LSERVDYHKSAKLQCTALTLTSATELPYFDGTNALTDASVGVDNRGRAIVFWRRRSLGQQRVINRSARQASGLVNFAHAFASYSLPLLLLLSFLTTTALFPFRFRPVLHPPPSLPARLLASSHPSLYDYTVYDIADDFDNGARRRTNHLLR